MAAFVDCMYETNWYDGGIGMEYLYFLMTVITKNMAVESMETGCFMIRKVPGRQSATTNMTSERIKLPCPPQLSNRYLKSNLIYLHINRNLGK